MITFKKFSPLLLLLMSGCQFRLLNQLPPFREDPSEYEKEKIAANNLASLSGNGVELSILRFMCLSTRAHALREDGTFTNLAAYPVIFGLKPETLCWTYVSIKNESPNPCTFNIRQGNVSFEEHPEVTVNLSENFGHPGNLDFLAGVIDPGDEYLTGIIIPIPEIAWDELGTMIYEIPSPICVGDNPVDAPYQFSIDTTNWSYEAMPEVLSQITKSE